MIRPLKASMNRGAGHRSLSPCPGLAGYDSFPLELRVLSGSRFSSPMSGESHAF